MIAVNDKIEYFDIRKLGDVDLSKSISKTITNNNGHIEIYGYSPEGSIVWINTINGWFNVTKNFHPNNVIANKYCYDKYLNKKYGVEYFFDNNGKVVKTIDHENGFKHTFEAILNKAILLAKENKFKSEIGFQDKSQDENLYTDKTFIWREKTDKSNIWYLYFYKPLLENIDLNINESSLRMCVIIDDSDGNETFNTVYYDRYDISIPPSNNSIREIRKTKMSENKSYRTYEGKNYTHAEWKIFEQEQYNEHLRKTSRADLIKSTETPKTDAKKSSFLADENDVKPKKKGFWG
ncbi:hypothetical protein [Chryseobacterium luteum]|uniref:Uncharacterized protein n=1 Tax=Chryseobacterium luteum TaxID=421531 RepID=A0A085ZAK4_9FLAO|nr:hypothetical protein [Chryseobacterium luteum]KFF01468.1 hypothetical protein IX38_17950 [Chryseobacterium luteum]